MATPNTFSIVLLGRYAGKDRAVAQAIARMFGRDDAWGLQVVGAAPIVLLHNLAPEQSEAILAALADVEAAGCQLEIQPGVDAGLPKLGWPAAPRIRGRLTTEFTTSPIPFAQSMQPLQPNAMGAQIMPATAPNPTTGQAAVVNLVVPCPYTGQKMKLTITVQVARAEAGGTALNIGATASQMGAAAPGSGVNFPVANSGRPPSRPNVLPAAYGGINTPLSNPAVRMPQAPAGSGQMVQRQLPGSGSRPIVSPPSPDMPVLNEGEMLIPLPDIPAAPASRPPVQRRSPAAPQRSIPTAAAAVPPAPPNSIIPLPDVPVIHGPNGNSFSAPSSNSNMPMITPMPSDPMSAPMDLDAFEAKVSASGIMRAVSPSDEAQEVFDDQNGDDGGVCSVFMGKTNNAKVHQLVAELHGISIPEATRYCQKPIVALAKEVSSADANDIRQRFAALNVNVRITKKK